MRGIILIVLLFPFSVAAFPFAGGTLFESVTEYRQDAIDFDSAEKKFFRERVGILPSEKSSFNFSYLRTEKSDDRYTWNLVLGDVVRSSEFIIGNYYENYGAGLILGKKSSPDFDPFSSGIIISREKTFTPCKSGNPYFCFNGISAVCKKKFSGLIFSVNPFVSVRYRHINDDDAEAGKTDQNLSTLTTKIDKKPGAGEPVKIMDAGMMLGLSKNEHFKSEAYFFHTDIVSHSGEEVLLNYTRGYDCFYAEKDYSAMGLYCRYEDDCVKLFFEIGIPRRTIRTEQGTKTAGDAAVLYGMRYRNNAFCLSIKGKETGNDFYSPYSSGYCGPEKTFMIYSHARLTQNILLGAVLINQNKLYGETAPSSIAVNKEKIFLMYRFSDIEKITLALRRLEENSGTGVSEKIQYKFHCRKKISECIHITLKGIVQDSNRDEISWLAGIGLRCTIRNIVFFSCGYERYEISGKNYLYSASAPFPDSITRGFFAYETMNVITAKLSCRYGGNFFLAGYGVRFAGEKILQHRMELLCRVLF